MKTRIVLCILLFLLVAAIGASMTGAVYGKKLLADVLDGRSERLAANETQVDEWDLYAEMIQSQAQARVGGWLSVVGQEQVTVETERGSLSADLYEPIGVEDDAPWAIVFHGGLGSSRSQVQDVACELSLAGYRVLTPDLYAHGLSDGEIASLGVNDAQDVFAWIGMIREWDVDPKIVLLGYDEGALAVLCAAAQELPEEVVAVALDSICIKPEERALDLLSQVEPGADGLQRQLFLLAYQIEHGVALGEMDVVQMASQIRVPALFFHGTGDEEVLAWQSEEAALACTRSQLCLIEGAAHGEARFVGWETYYKTLLMFFEEALSN